MSPSTNPKFSLITLASGAKQFVVQEALLKINNQVQRAYLIISNSGLYLSQLTPMTNIGASLDGAVMITFFAPPTIWPYTKSVHNNYLGFFYRGEQTRRFNHNGSISGGPIDFFGFISIREGIKCYLLKTLMSLLLTLIESP